MSAAATVVFLLFFILPTIVFSLSMTCVPPCSISTDKPDLKADDANSTNRSLGCSLHALLRNTRLKDDADSSPRANKVHSAPESLV